ncbi:MAG: hypothetical protein PHY34_04765 [Patescibacteria group bacterium]|nr:hypothetical protein [Patescibacteria group bacterium]MDD5715619.1 hypothetical protein [Patescibacteria group bacterium]
MAQQLAHATKSLTEYFNQPEHLGAFDATKIESRIKVHETVGKMGFVYEKIRNAIDYQEEHLIRKNAIGRMLKRRIRSRERGPVIAEPLVRELIRAGYIKNDTFPTRRLPDIERIIDKYITLIHYAVGERDLFTGKSKTFNWIASVAAFEIEEYLSPSTDEDALVEAMYKIIRPNVNIQHEVPDPEDQDIQVYLAVHRALIKSDPSMLRYHLFHYYVPEWPTMSLNAIPEFAQSLPQLIEHIEQQYNNKLSDRLFRYARKFAPLFTILKDVLKQHRGDATGVLSDPARLEAAVREAAQLRYRQASAKLSRGVFRSIIYIFLTKTIMAFVFELPYEALLLHEIKLLPLAINIIFHPTLMFFIATSIRVPAEKNTQRLIKGVFEIVYNPPDKEIIAVREQTFKRSTLLNAIFSTVYSAAFFVTFGGIIWGLHALHFSLVSGILFIFFLCVISFFGLRLRDNAKELVIVSSKDNILMLVFEFFTLPILRAGRWIARKTSKVNVFMFLMDFIIEAPFKILVETIEDWLAFTRQKRDELI